MFVFAILNINKNYPKVMGFNFDTKDKMIMNPNMLNVVVSFKSLMLIS